MRRCRHPFGNGPTKRVHQTVVAGLLGVFSFSMFFPVMAADPVASVAPSVSKGGGERVPSVFLHTVLDPAPTDQEQKIFTGIQENFADAKSNGLWDPSEGRTLTFLHVSKVLFLALQHNLTIQMGALDRVIVKQAVEEAEAVFAPVFHINLSHSGSMVYERQRSGLVLSKRSQPKPKGKTYLEIEKDPSAQYPIDRIGYLQKQESVEEKTYEVSKAQDPGWKETERGSLSIQQQLPWGPRILLAKDTSYVETYYDAKRGRSWGAPWAISVKASLNTPLPFSKNFGSHSALNTALEQAKIADKKVDWTVKKIINDTLRDALLAYWDLVQNLENLRVSMDHRRYMEVQMAHVRRMSAIARMTQYAEDQMRLALARAKVKEAAARQSLVTASSALLTLIEEEQTQAGASLFFPMGYQSWLVAEDPVDAQGAVATALKRRPELQSSELDVQSTLLTQRFRKNQTRPDVSLSVSGNLKQSNATYGYKSFGNALFHVSDPDSRSFNSSVTYTYPWQNRAVKAALAQSKYATEQTRLSRQFLEQTVQKEVGTALVALLSARARLESARNNEILAELALEKAVKRWKSTEVIAESAEEVVSEESEAMGEEGGEVGEEDLKAKAIEFGEMELLDQLRRILDTRLARVSAMVANKKAESTLVAAQGILGEELPSQLAVNPFDRRRLALLASRGATPHFSRAR